MKEFETMKDIKAIYIGLDRILIETISGRPKPEGIWDMKFRFDVLHTIKTVNPKAVFIVDSIDGSTTGSIHKLDYILSAIKEYLDNIHVYYFCTNAIPNCNKCTVELLDFYYQYIRNCNHMRFKKSELLLVGNSKVHKQAAKDFGIIYLNVEFFRLYDLTVDKSIFDINEPLNYYDISSNHSAHSSIRDSGLPCNSP